MPKMSIASKRVYCITYTSVIKVLKKQLVHWIKCEKESLYLCGNERQYKIRYAYFVLSLIII